MQSRSKKIQPEKALKQDDGVIVLGGGLAGLSAGFVLAKAGRPVKVFESDHVVGGLSKTVVRDEFRFDLGGHRFITKSRKIEHFVSELLDGEFSTISRKSKIYMHQKFFDYPLTPSNAVFGLGVSTTLRTLYDYGKEKVRNFFRSPVSVSLEDWVISNFGRTMFDLYFKEYSEKVWGIECGEISQEWVARRIKGLSMWTAVKNAFFKFSGQDIDTLADLFIYPRLGIGQISENMKEGIEKQNSVLTDTGVTQIKHEDFEIESITAENCDRKYSVEGREFISSIPLTRFVQMLTPAAPADILEAASCLKYRDLVIVVTMLDREKVTDLTWLYLPEQDIPFGRIHEPKNWSPDMAPKGKTHIVSEYFCFEGDRTWNTGDEELCSTTVEHLEKMGFISRSEVTGSCVVRVPRAYPLFEVGYTEHYDRILEYLANFSNLHVIGRSGMFRYYNMDHAIESGIEAAEDILGKEDKEIGR